VVIGEPVEPEPPVPSAFEDGAAVVPVPVAEPLVDFDELHAEAMRTTAAAAEVMAMSLRCMPFSLVGEDLDDPQTTDLARASRQP
jgi:hypothetical protein